MSFDKKAFIKFLDEQWFFQSVAYATDAYPFLLKSIQDGKNTYDEASFFKEGGDKDACIEFVKDAIEKGKKLSVLLKEIDDSVDKCIEIADEIGLPFSVVGDVTYSPNEGGWTSSAC